MDTFAVAAALVPEAEAEPKNEFSGIDELLGYDTEDTTPVNADSLTMAVYLMEKRAELKLRQDELRRVMKVKKDIIQAWFDKTSGPIDDKVDAIEGFILSFVQTERLVNKKFVLTTPDGSAFPVNSKEKIGYDDEKIVIEYLKKTEQVELLRVKHELDKKKINALFEVFEGDVINPADDDATVPGTVVIPAKTSLTVRK